MAPLPWSISLAFYRSSHTFFERVCCYHWSKWLHFHGQFPKHWWNQMAHHGRWWRPAWPARHRDRPQGDRNTHLRCRALWSSDWTVGQEGARICAPIQTPVLTLHNFFSCPESNDIRKGESILLCAQELERFYTFQRQKPYRQKF